jgi:predicted MPP superfamily phosphohydrolase
MSDRTLGRLSSLVATPAGRAIAATVGAGAAGLFYATVIERNAFALRHVTMPVLEPGSTPLRVLHISDLHMMPNQYLKQAWVSELAALEPDLVVNTGDNLAHPKALPARACSSSAPTTTSVRRRRIR